MRNKFFVFPMLSLFIIGLLLVVLIETTSQIGQAIPPSDPYHIDYFNMSTRLIGQDFYYCGENDWQIEPSYYSSSNRIYNCISSNPNEN